MTWRPRAGGGRLLPHPATVRGVRDLAHRWGWRTGSQRTVFYAIAGLALFSCCCMVCWHLAGAATWVVQRMVDGVDLSDCSLLLTAADQQTIAALDDEQYANAELIIHIGGRIGVPPRGWVIAVATAMQESSLRNLAHGDRDSLGLFQQRPSQGWGTPEQIMDPEYATGQFYRALLEVDRWEQLPLTVAAQAVQRSAHPHAYAAHEPLAVAMVETVAGAGGTAGLDDQLRCPTDTEVSTAGWTAPTPGQVTSGFRSLARPDHYGIDTSDARGTVVRAASDGTVVLVTCNASLNGASYSCDVDGSPQVAGCGWYVDILHPGGIVTRYCHLAQRPDVQTGDQVAAGQPVGVVGSSGRSSGPHLHFEVELRTVLDRDSNQTSVERRQVDPVVFLAARGIALDCASGPAYCNPVHGDRVRVEHR